MQGYTKHSYTLCATMNAVKYRIKISKGKPTGV